MIQVRAYKILRIQLEAYKRQIQFLIIIFDLQMQQESKIKYSSKISAESRRSQLSSCRSLQRQSWSDRDHSLTKNKSLIQVMSLQGSKKSDLYQKMLAEDIQVVSNNRKSNPINAPTKSQFKSTFNPFKTSFKVEPPQLQRFSYDEDSETKHICLCYLKCNGQTCPCFSAFNEQCTIDLCCKQCINSKNSRMNTAAPLKVEKVFCTCKKTKCNKKYCSCFAAGLKCGIECNCEDCLNCDRIERMDVEPVCIVDQEIRRMEMPQSMDFEPFQFRYSYNN